MFRVDPPNSPTLHSLLYFSVSVFCISVNLYVCIFNFFESTLPTHLTFCISLFSFFLICIFVFVFVCLSISIFVFSNVLRWPSQLSFTALGLILFASFYYARVLQRLYFLLGKSWSLSIFINYHPLIFIHLHSFPSISLTFYQFVINFYPSSPIPSTFYKFSPIFTLMNISEEFLALSVNIVSGYVCVCRVHGLSSKTWRAGGKGKGGKGRGVRWPYHGRTLEAF